MTAEDLFINNGGNWQTVKAVSESLPQFNVVSPFALIIESIDAVDGGALVVTTQQEEVLGILNLVGQQQANGLQRLLATIYVISKKQVVGFWGESSIFKQPQQVIVLAVNVTCKIEFVSIKYVTFIPDCIRNVKKLVFFISNQTKPFNFNVFNYVLFKIKGPLNYFCC